MPEKARTDREKNADSLRKKRIEYCSNLLAVLEKEKKIDEISMITLKAIMNEYVSASYATESSKILVVLQKQIHAIKYNTKEVFYKNMLKQEKRLDEIQEEKKKLHLLKIEAQEKRNKLIPDPVDNKININNEETYIDEDEKLELDAKLLSLKLEEEDIFKNMFTAANGKNSNESN